MPDEPAREQRVYDITGLTAESAARAYDRLLRQRAMQTPAASFVNDQGPSEPEVATPSMTPRIDPKTLSMFPGQAHLFNSDGTAKSEAQLKAEAEKPTPQSPSAPSQNQGVPGQSAPQTVDPSTSAQAPAPGASPQPVPEQVESQPADNQGVDRIDPELVASIPALATMYNPDGTLKSNEQLGAEQAAVDMAGLPAVLAENQNGTTPLPGGGKVDKSINVGSDGWQVETIVNLSDGTTVQLNGGGIDVEQLPNGRSATTMSYGDANSDARNELARMRQAMLSGSQGIAPAGTSPWASGIEHAGDAEQVISALDLLVTSPAAPVRIIKDINGRIVSISVLDLENGEHVVLLNSGVNSFDQGNGINFEFYRDASGVMSTPGGERIIEIDNQFILVDKMGNVIPTRNSDVGQARIFDPAMNPTGYTHGVSAGGAADSQFGYPALIESGPDSFSARLSVEMPNEPGTLRSLTEIPVPAGLTADKAYRVSGGGIVVVDKNGAHWATDPGSPPTPEEVVNAVTEEIFWLAVGEGIS
ncbi:hypothetical protein ACFWPJ_24995, partial [Nocardia sp. NPDC058497]